MVQKQCSLYTLLTTINLLLAGGYIIRAVTKSFYKQTNKLVYFYYLAGYDKYTKQP